MEILGAVVFPPGLLLVSDQQSPSLFLAQLLLKIFPFTRLSCLFTSIAAGIERSV